jgi:hypothetical protein
MTAPDADLFAAIDAMREFNDRARELNDERKAAIEDMRANGIQVEMVKAAARVLGKDDPQYFEAHYAFLRDLLERYCKFNLARKSLRAPARKSSPSAAPASPPDSAETAAAPELSSTGSGATSDQETAGPAGGTEPAAEQASARGRPDNLDIPEFLRAEDRAAKPASAAPIAPGDSNGAQA